MTAVLVDELSEETHRAIARRASRHGRTVEEEIRVILDDVVRIEVQLKIGSELAELGRRFRGVDLRIERDRQPTRPVNFD